MSETYTVAVNSSTPVEILDGRVGHFILKCTAGYYIGASDVDSGDIFLEASVQHIYVTSPDEVYVLLSGDPTGTLKVFHNR